MKIPKYKEAEKTTVTYHFEGGVDMTDLFIINITYARADGKQVTEPVHTLPWSMSVETKLPYKAYLKAKLNARSDIPQKALYDVGFKGYLNYTASDGSVVTPISSTSRAQTGNADPNVLHLRITPPPGISYDRITLRPAPLKFDKHFAFTLSIDDSYASAYSRIWSLIHGKWIDDREFCHLGRPRSTGYTPDYPLVTTDGCGNDRRFGFSCAIWPTLGDGNTEPRIKDAAKTADNSVYISWEELALMTDFGVSLLYHNVDERIWGKSDPQLIARGFSVDNQKTYVKTGTRMKVLGVPDGNQAYVDAARISDEVVFMRNSLSSNRLIYLRDCGSLYKKDTYSSVGTSAVQPKLDELAQQSAASDPYWVALTYHRPDSACMQMLRNVYELYGKPGKDNLWVASWDEIYEYVSLREGVRITCTPDGDALDCRIELPDRTDFQFEELSLLLDGAPGAIVEAVSANISGLTHAPRADAELINLRFGKRWERLAEKYVAEYEAVASLESLADARYFVGQLLPALAGPFERRLAQIVPPNKDQVTFEGAKRYQKQYEGYVFELNRTLSVGK